MKADMDADIDDFRQAFQSLAATAEPTEDCPEAPRLWAAARGEAPPDETRELIDHTASCAACAEAWRLAVHLEEEAPAARAAPSVARWWPAAAAAALVVVAVGVHQLREPAAPPVMRAAAESGLLSELAADATLPRDAAVLEWRLEPPREGARHAVRVTTEDLHELAAADDLATPAYVVPPEALTGLEPGTRVLWRVESFLPDGRRLSSETFTVRIE